MFKNRSITFKLILVISLCSALIFAISIGYFYYQSRLTLERELKENARNLVLASVNRVESVLSSIDKVTEGVARSIETGNYTKETLDILLKETLVANNDIFGFGTAVEPNRSGSYLRLVAHYFYRKDGQVTFYPGSDTFLYPHKDWYQIPRELKTKVWSEPYYDDVANGVLMTTCSVPFFDNSGSTRSFRGTVGADVSLERLTEMVLSVKVLKTGYSILLSRNGTILTHPSKAMIMNESVFSLAESRNMPKLREIGRKMIRGESDFIPYTDTRGVKSWMYYSPIPSTGWTLAVVFPEAELFADVRALTIKVSFISFAGILLLAATVALIARSITTPLHDLAEATEVIASGNFDAELPTVRSNDEVGKLTQSFISMNSSLKEYVKNLTETTAAKERIHSELRVATEIQSSLLPRQFPAFPDRKEFEIFASMDPAKEVGGDFYDFFFIDESNLCFIIADVADKGVPAALYMMMTKTLLKSEGQKYGEPDRILSCVNSILAADNDKCMFATVFCGILNTVTGVVRFANAGHNPPIFIDSGETAYLQLNPGFVLGPFMDTVYETETVTLKPGDILFLYTDGVTEAKNQKEELYGESRLVNAVQQQNGENPASMLQSVRNGVREFVNGAPQSDDITMLVIKYLG